MNSAPPACRQPIAFDTLVEHWLGELDDARTQQVDEHLLGCDACGAQLDEIIALGEGVRGAFNAGLFGTAVGADFPRRLSGRGLRLREYRVERNGSVNCSIDPQDDVLISRLSAPLSGIERLDLVRVGVPGEPEFRAADIPFDAASGEVVFVMPAARLRKMPSYVEHMRLVAVDPSGERLIGDYTFNHRASG
ncbi:zf-HC2 domain-containing protein [Variovorax sp. J22R133]|uniref:anti-sigma factor family protein n=1 Tax=Variovorax brevis TaxID=3053503 RepID=UPI0025775DEE|nr:zf-HC2 domain-containing protein [Variovorax sp. J22R133]MDM0110781.1 zf-HC2 domain-containing protein [Variovorax sp. J22R133]